MKSFHKAHRTNRSKAAEQVIIISIHIFNITGLNEGEYTQQAYDHRAENKLWCDISKRLQVLMAYMTDWLLFTSVVSLENAHEWTKDLIVLFCGLTVGELVYDRPIHPVASNIFSARI